MKLSNRKENTRIGGILEIIPTMRVFARQTCKPDSVEGSCLPVMTIPLEARLPEPL